MKHRAPPPSAVALAAAGLLSGCVAYRVGAGPTRGLGAEAPDAYTVEVGMDATIGPKKRLRGPRGRRGPEVIDIKAPCHYGLGLGLRTSLGQDVAVGGPAVDAFGHCHLSGPLGVGGRAGLTLFQLGAQQRLPAAGLGSPYLQAGPRLRLHDVLSLEVNGVVEAQLRPGEPRSYGAAGAMLWVSYGIQP